ncbi:phosphopantetheine-binding protein [Streptomyces sp. NPDC002520]
MTEDEVFRTLCDAVIRALPEVDRASLSPQSTLQGLGANSLDRLDILLDVKEALATEVSVRDLAGAPDMAGLTAILYRSCESRT